MIIMALFALSALACMAASIVEVLHAAQYNPLDGGEHNRHLRAAAVFASAYLVFIAAMFLLALS